MSEADKSPICVAIILSCHKYLSSRAFDQDITELPFEFRYFVGERDPRRFTNIALPTNVVELPCKDNYESLVFKVHEAIKWVSSNLEFDYILKTDDDIIFDSELILNLYDKILSNSVDYGGHFVRPEKMPLWSYMHQHSCEDPILKCIPAVSPQLPYASGGAYFLSKKAVNAYLNHFPLMRKDIIFEDGFMGACMQECPSHDDIRQGRWVDNDFRDAFQWDG